MTVEQCWHQVPGGSGSYVRELVRALTALGGTELVGLRARHSTPGPEGLDLPVRASALPRPLLYEAWNRLRRPSALATVGPSDVVHATTWAVPGGRTPLVVTVHDLAFLRAPEHFTARGNAYFRRALRIVQDEAAAVVVPSRATRDDCLAAGFEPDRLHVVPHGVRARAVAPHEIEEWRRRHHLTRPYVLWCGTLEPRKNLGGLLEAYALARADLDLDLVLAGPDGWGGVPHQLESLLQRLPADRVHRVGRLSDRDLQTAYAGARVFAFPSFWEGFGMPVLEAMAQGVPVVTSERTSMAEFVADAGVVVDPRDPQALAHGIVLAAGTGHRAMSEAARRASATSTWEASARAHRDVYRSAVGR